MAVVEFQDLQPRSFQRICAVGVSGGGKSWLSERLSTALNAKYIKLDQLYWEPNWQEAEAEVLKSRLRAAMNNVDKWVVDGNYHGKTGAIKFPNATLVVWVDPSFPRTIYQALGRAIQRIRSNQEVWPGTGNRETFRRTFLSNDSIVLWTLTSFGPIRKRYFDLWKNSDLPVLRMVSRKQANQLLAAAASSAEELGSATTTLTRH